VYLTFEELRGSRTVGDIYTRTRVALPCREVARLRELLGEPIDGGSAGIAI
jgi:hypothetical protein